MKGYTNIKADDWGVKLEYGSLITFVRREGINLVKEYISY